MSVFSRGDFLRLASLGFLFPESESEPKPKPEPEPPVTERPNILLLVSDDFPFHMQNIMTKTNAAFAGGLFFDNAYVASPLCGPSRATALFTGRYPHNNGMRSNQNTARLFRDQGWAPASLPSLLKAQGYTNGLFGKFLNEYREIASYVPAGFRDTDDEWVALLAQYDPVVLNRNGMVRKPRLSPGGPLVRTKHETAYLAEKAVEFIQTAPEPWLCIAAVTAPHDPYTPSDAHKNEFANVTMPARPNFDLLDPGKPEEVRAATPMSSEKKAKMLAEWRGKAEESKDFDDAVDAIMAATDHEATYSFYFADNGYMLGEHGLFEKARPYEESSKTPLLVRGPGVRGGETSDKLASLVDVPATVLELCGLEDEATHTDGRSLVPLLFGAEEPGWRDALLIEQVGLPSRLDTTWSAVRSDERLYVEHATGERELYDLAADPYQTTNLAAATTNMDLADLASRLSEMKAASSDTLRSAEA